MKQIDIMKNNHDLFKILNPPPSFDSMCAEKGTFDLIVDSLVKNSLPKIPKNIGEFWGIKIYVDEDCPKNKVRFKMRGITVQEIYAFEPKED